MLILSPLSNKAYPPLLLRWNMPGAPTAGEDWRARRELLAVAAVTLLGAVLRVFNLGAQSLWLDELSSVIVSRADWRGVIAATIAGDTVPPLFNLLLHVALQFGSGEVAARALSCALSVATVPLFYVLAREMFDARVAFVAALALALGPFHVLYAQEARMYALLAFCSLAAITFFQRGWRDGGKGAWTAFTVAMALTTYAHTLGFLTLFALDVFALSMPRRLRQRWPALVLAHAGVGAAWLMWLPSFIQQLGRVQSGFWAAAPTPFKLFTTPYLLLFGPAAPGLVFPVALLAGLTLVGFASLVAARPLRAGGQTGDGLRLAIILALLPMLTLFVLSYPRPIFVERTLIASSFALYLLIAWALVHAPSPVVIRLTAGVALVCVSLALGGYYFDPQSQKPHMREAARLLSDLVEPGDSVAHTSDSSSMAFLYYAPWLPNHFLAGDPDYTALTTRRATGLAAGLAPEDAAAATGGAKRLWLVVAVDHNEEYQMKRVAEFDAKYGRLDTRHVLGIRILLYRLSAPAYGRTGAEGG
jgi:hypothetical protein